MVKLEEYVELMRIAFAHCHAVPESWDKCLDYFIVYRMALNYGGCLLNYVNFAI